MKKMIIRKEHATLSRRKFIVGSAAVAGGGLALGLNVPFGVGAAQAQSAATEVNVWVAIKPDDTCVIRIARSEMGQGTLTGLAQLVAEELECDWNKVTTEGITPGRNLAQQARLGRDGHRRQPRHPHLAGLCPARRRGGAHDAAAGRGRAMEGAGRRAHRVRRRHHARGEQAHDPATARSRPRPPKLTPPDPKSHQAQGSEGLEDRRQAAEAARHRRQAQRQQDLRHRPETAGHALRRDQGLPGVRRQAQELRREQDRRHARREEGGEGEGHRRRRRRRHLVARQEGARCAADRLGRGRERRRIERDDRRACSRMASTRPPPMAIARTAMR